MIAARATAARRAAARRLVATTVALALALVALVALVASDARAAPPEAPTPSLTLHAGPVFGPEGSTGGGWMDIVAHLDNAGAAPLKGTLELAASTMWSGGEIEAAATAPFHVPPGRSATVAMPTHGYPYYVAQMTLTAYDEHRQKLATVPVTVNGANGPLLVDVDQPSRLGVALRGWPILATWSPGSTGTGATSSALTVGAPSFDRTTGDPILPERAAGWSAATVVVLHSDTLAALDDVRRDALIGWVLGGGSLALVPSRPEDLRGPIVRALLGGDVRAAAVPPALLRLPATERPATTPSMGTPYEDDPDAPAAPPSGGGDDPGDKAAPRTLRVGPTAAVRDRLSGWAGGNLRPSDFGASAPYGNGEIHLLAFDPTASPMLDDPWVQSRVIDLVARAWDRRARVAFPMGGGDRGWGRTDDVRRALDPNENFRVGLGLSALLLVVYSLVAGPLTFLRAAKAGKPLRPLAWAPVWSAAAFGAIVLIGLAGKGWRGRSRRLAIVEAGGGASRAVVRRYRGFFASEARSLSVAATDRACVLEVVPTDGSRTDRGVARIDRDGMTLGELTSLPWQTVVVREDGFVDTKGGVGLWPEGGDLTVENRTGHRLRDVVVKGADGQLHAFDAIEDGARVRASTGRALSGGSVPGRTTTAGVMNVHPLGAEELRAMLGGAVGERFLQAWGALQSAAGEEVDWWPDGQPVLLGEIVGLPKTARDAGLAVESERTMLRVVGSGGAS